MKEFFFFKIQRASGGKIEIYIIIAHFIHLHFLHILLLWAFEFSTLAFISSIWEDVLIRGVSNMKCVIYSSPHCYLIVKQGTHVWGKNWIRWLGLGHVLGLGSFHSQSLAIQPEGVHFTLTSLCLWSKTPKYSCTAE